MSNIKLELVSDIEQHHFIKNGLRGGISIITHRKGVAKNKNLKEYDRNKQQHLCLT